MSAQKTQKNTLLNYFKSPKSSTPSRSTTSTPAAESPKTENGSTPIRPALTPSNRTPTLKVKHGFSQSAHKQDKFKNGNLVWAKLDGYPWWPSMVCLHPVKQVECHSGKVHVQFFDNPPTRSWIHMKFVKHYEGSQHYDKLGVEKPVDDAWKTACEEGDAALKMSEEDRLSLVTTLLPSDEENTTTPETPRNNKTKSGPTKKRRRIIVEEDSADDSGEEYKPVAIESSSESEVEDNLSEEADEASMAEDDSYEEVGSSRKRKPKTKSVTSTPLNLKSFHSGSPATPHGTDGHGTPRGVSQGTKQKLSEFSFREEADAKAESNSDGRHFTHLSCDFLKPDKIRDGNRRRPDDPEYDPRTLYIPEEYKRNLTPAMRQWWEMKAKHFDIILFFKMGKFYELYHMDALIAVKELGIILMKGDAAHCGFPERGFSKYSSLLIERGHKVARIEQTETPEMMTERCKKLSRPSKFDRVVERELCQITSKGTRTYNVIEGDNWQVDHHFLLAITEKLSPDSAAGGCIQFGVAFVDTSIGTFHLGHFDDDRYRSRLSTLLTRFNPVEIISARRSISAETRQVLNSACPDALHETVSPSSDCWDSSKTLRLLAEGDYFKENGEFSWPKGIQPFLDDSSSLGLIPKEESEMAVRSLGALCSYLKQCQLDQELLSRQSFQVYQPVDQSPLEEPTLGSHMVLDGMTLRNLDVLMNSTVGTTHGTLFERLNRCNTAFGQRLLRHWICAPLIQPEAIRDRQDAVEYLINNSSVLEEVGKILKSLPDLERLVNKIHSQGSSLRARNHPDSRAIFFDSAVYSKKKITDFLMTLDGFRAAQKVEEYFQSHTIESKLLRQSVQLKENGGNFPNMTEVLDFFRDAFDHQQAQKEGKMIPRPGVDKEFDRALEEIAEIQVEAEQYLMQQKTFFGGKVCFVGAEKKRFQLEVSDSASTRADHRYELQGQRKGFKRYYTKESRAFIQRLMAAEDHRDTALKDISRRIFAQFDEHHLLWEKAAGCLAIVDVLMALATFAVDQQVCRPRIVDPAEVKQPFMRLLQGRHPSHSQLFVNSEYIPNNVDIGSSGKSLILVTGPNMGGKSTLMRQVGLCVILAQMGSFVPAEEFELTPVDRLFTRLGANDHILGGESTFFVELSETAAILKHATAHSLILLDELGRGTATFDGTAIAYAVADNLAQRRCRTLFSTHYHSLVHDLATHPQVALGHMACMAENDEQVDDPSEESIIFLYQFTEGACPKSYGFHAARLAGLDRRIISRGYQRSKEMEARMDSIRLSRDLHGAQPLASCLA